MCKTVYEASARAHPHTISYLRPPMSALPYTISYLRPAMIAHPYTISHLKTTQCAHPHTIPYLKTTKRAHPNITSYLTPSKNMISTIALFIITNTTNIRKAQSISHIHTQYHFKYIGSYYQSFFSLSQKHIFFNINTYKNTSKNMITMKTTCKAKTFKII